MTTATSVTTEAKSGPLTANSRTNGPRSSQLPTPSRRRTRGLSDSQQKVLDQDEPSARLDRCHPISNSAYLPIKHDRSSVDSSQMAGTPASCDAVTTLPRAVAFRALFIFAPIALIVAMAAAASKDMPVGLVVSFFGTFGTIALILAVRTDTKLRVDLGKPDAPWSGTYSAWIPVDADVTPDKALTIARRAVSKAQAHDIRTLENHTVIGWVGSAWTNAPRQQAYQIAVVISAQPESLTQMICCARPRFSLVLFGAGMSQEWATRLQRAVLDQL